MAPKTTKNPNARTSWKVSNCFELLNLSEDGAKKNYFTEIRVKPLKYIKLQLTSGKTVRNHWL